MKIWFREFYYDEHQFLVCQELHFTGELHLKIYGKDKEDVFLKTYRGFKNQKEIDDALINFDYNQYLNEEFKRSWDTFLDDIKEKYKWMD